MISISTDPFPQHGTSRSPFWKGKKSPKGTWAFRQATPIQSPVKMLMTHGFYTETMLVSGRVEWVAVKKLKLRYRDQQTLVFTTYPYYGDPNP